MDAFTICIPDTVKEQAKRAPTDPMFDLPRYRSEDFEISVYRWPNVKASQSLRSVPKEWSKTKNWATVSNISEAKTKTGVPYVTFQTRMIRYNCPPFDSTMAVIRAASGKAYMFQMTGDQKVINDVCKSIQRKRQPDGPPNGPQRGSFKGSK